MVASWSQIICPVIAELTGLSGNETKCSALLKIPQNVAVYAVIWLCNSIALGK
jgi:hypothetical protein